MSDNTGIGYNQSQALAVVEEMESGLSGLKTAMEDNWTSLTSTFQTNWVGEDESAFESAFADELRKMYKNCDVVVSSAMKYIVDAANAWAQWQTNVAGQFVEGTSVTALDEYSHTSEEIAITAATQSFGQDTTRGLQSSNAQQALVGALDGYVQAVIASFDSVYTSINASSAFVGAEQSAAMNTFIGGLSENLKSVLKMVDNFKEETIPQLVEGYKNQEGSIKSDDESFGKSITDEIDNINSGN